MPDIGQNHEIWSESGPYGSVRADTLPESTPYGLGCLQNASSPPKSLRKSKIPGIPGFRDFCGFLLIIPYFPDLLAVHFLYSEGIQELGTIFTRLQTR